MHSSWRYKVRSYSWPLDGKFEQEMFSLYGAQSYPEHSTSDPWLWSRSQTEPHSTGRRTSNTLFLRSHQNELFNKFFFVFSTVEVLEELTIAGKKNVSGVEVSTQDALLMQTLQS